MMRLSLTTAVLTLVATCLAQTAFAQSSPVAPPMVSIANPASVACAYRGGRSETVPGPQGEIGVCVLPNGPCEEWALFRDQRCDAPPVMSAEQRAASKRSSAKTSGKRSS